jgi:hypothetical protein
MDFGEVFLRLCGQPKRDLDSVAMIPVNQSSARRSSFIIPRPTLKFGPKRDLIESGNDIIINHEWIPMILSEGLYSFGGSLLQIAEVKCHLPTQSQGHASFATGCVEVVGYWKLG